MNIEVCSVFFFNRLCIKRASAFIIELHKGIIYNFVKFEYESFRPNIEQAFKEEKHKKKKIINLITTNDQKKYENTEDVKKRKEQIVWFYQWIL